MNKKTLLTRRLLLQTTAAAAALVTLKLQAYEDAGAGRRFETMDLDWADAARQRAVPVRLYLPAPSTVAEVRAPLVVFSHGIGGSRRGYSYLGQHFARNGVASLHLQHVGSDRNLWMGNVWGLVGRLQAAAQESEALARVQDLRFALDTLRPATWPRAWTPAASWLPGTAMAPTPPCWLQARPSNARVAIWC